MRQEQEQAGVDTLSLSALLARYVSRQATRIQDGGLAPELGSEIVLHEAGAAQAVDPRLAWDEAIAALQTASKSALPALSTVPDWRALVAAQEPALDLAFCAGNFPQMVRNLSLLLAGEAGSQGAPFRSTSLTTWAEQSSRKPFPQPLLAVGLLRLSQDFDRARRLLKDREADVPAEWKATWKNEEAALAWHSGQLEEAASLWMKGDAEHAPTLFNRGMAALFLERPADAIAPLRQAVARLPETSSWHHLARLYLTLAEMRQ
jgi:hypothetical protein